nr:hypothetical protein Iba_chr13bCG6980 [Ipomoea batatas]
MEDVLLAEDVRGGCGGKVNSEAAVFVFGETLEEIKIIIPIKINPYSYFSWFDPPQLPRRKERSIAGRRSMDREAATFAATNHCSGGVGIGNGGRRWEVAAKMPMSDGEVASGGGASGGVKGHSSDRRAMVLRFLAKRAV